MLEAITSYQKQVTDPSEHVLSQFS